MIFVFALALLLPGNLQTTHAENLDKLSNYSIQLSISPSMVEEGSKTHPVGYVYVENAKGIPITSDSDIQIKLTSDNSDIALVPNEITLMANSEFSKFDIVSGETGDTVITATLNDKMDFEHFQVGTESALLPDDLSLELNIPTDQMHVFSDMPFSVYLKTSEGDVIRAPYDIKVNLEYEESLALPNSDNLVIKKGEFYAWGTITTNDKVGNTYLRAVQDETQLDTAKSIQISSTFPSSLSLMVYPELIHADINRKLSIFVSLLDSSGNPTIAAQDIPLKFFSNDQNFIGEGLDKAMKEHNPVIKKGEFGYLFEPTFNMVGFLSNDVVIGVSAEGYGIAQDTFSTVGESISTSDERVFANSIISQDNNQEAIDNKMIDIFGPLKIPSNSTAVFSYQMKIEETDDDDPENLEESLTELDKNEILIYDIDYLEEGESYPIQSNQDFRAEGVAQLLGVVSSDNSILNIEDPGMIETASSFGSAIVSSGQKSGEVTISVNVNGVGSNSFSTEVVNSLEQEEIRVFSPTGIDSILFNRDGSFDIFLVAVDGENRPKMLDSGLKYLVTPTNEIVALQEETSFTFASLESDSFSLVNGDVVELNISPIGENADLTMESFKTFETHLSSQVLVTLPISNPNLKHDEHLGIAQIADLQGNPILASKDIKTKIFSNDPEIAQPEDVVIKQGSSYAEFPFETSGTLGDAVITANAKGLVGSNATLSTTSSSTKLKISTGGLVEPFSLNDPKQIKLFVDDENNESVEGAEITIMSNENSTSSSEVVRTDKEGSATVSLTALNGPEISYDLFASAEGYVGGERTLIIQVDSVTNTGFGGNSELIMIAAIAILGVSIGVGTLVVMKRKNSEKPIEEEWEDEDI